jgi:hypothetical protein
MNNFIAVKDDGEGVLGKLLYYSLSSILIDKDELERICENVGFPYTQSRRSAPADAFRNATGDIYNTKTVKSAYGAERFKIYCRDNKSGGDVISRELVKETLDTTANKYKKLANITFSKDYGFSYGDVAYDEHFAARERGTHIISERGGTALNDPYEYCREAERLFELYQTCAGRKQIETLLEAFVDSLQAVKLLAHGKMYFIPREYMPKLDVFEDLIQLLEKHNQHESRNRAPLDANSMFVVDDAKQREKMAAAFYRSVRREIEEYSERADHLIQTGSQSAAIMERWAVKIQGLETKKREYEDVLRRELGELDEEFRALGFLAEELAIRARGIRRRAA